MNEFKVSVIICAAGKGERAKFNKNKLLVPVFGAPVLLYTLEKFKIDEVDEVIVTSSKEDFKEISALCAPFGFKVVLGGATRTQSVKLALEKITGDIVLIHDGARPYVSKKLISNCIESVKNFGSGICSVSVPDAAVYLKDGEYINLDKSRLKIIQTPQGFLTSEIKKAYSLCDDTAYADDGEVYKKYIREPRLIRGDKKNVKLTYREDFNLDLPPTTLPEPEVQGDLRIGFGVDVHCFCGGNFVTLGGVKIPCEKALTAHSDGDVIIHAVIDSLLSAAGLKDIGTYFPDTDDSFKGADSINLLRKTLKIIKDKNLVPVNLSVSVQAEIPKLSPYIDQIKNNLCSACSLPESRIAISAGTCEKLGFVGRKEGITAYSIVLCKLINED